MQVGDDYFQSRLRGYAETAEYLVVLRISIFKAEHSVIFRVLPKDG